MHRLIFAATLAIAVGAFTVAYVVTRLNSMVAAAIESVGSQAAGVPVRVSSVNISLKSGRGTLKGLTVDNPPGFRSGTAISVPEIHLSIDQGRNDDDPIVITNVELAEPEITYEYAADSGSNIAQILRNSRDYFRNDTGKEGSVDASSPARATTPLIIDQLQVKGGKVVFYSAWPFGRDTVPLPDISLAHLGRDKGGATAAEVAALTMWAVSADAHNAARQFRALPKEERQRPVDQVKTGLGEIEGELGGSN